MNIDQSSPPLQPDPPAGSKFVTLPSSGFKLRYTDTTHAKGETAPVPPVTILLLHGFAAVLETWDYLTPHLRNKFRVVAVDLIGNGYSDMPTSSSTMSQPFDYSYRNQGTMISDLIQALGLLNVILVGHSSGVVVAGATVDQNKDGNILGAIFVAPGAFFRSKNWMITSWWMKPVIRMMMKYFIKHRVDSLRKMHVNPDKALTSELLAKFLAPTQMKHYHEATVQTAMASEDPWIEILQKLPKGTPLHFIWGAQDTTTPLPAEQQQKIDEMVLAGELKRDQITTSLVDGGHYLHHEHADNIAKQIISFAQTKIHLREHQVVCAAQ